MLRSTNPRSTSPEPCCALFEVKDKFTLFVRDTFEPISFLEAAFNAGLDQASKPDPTYRQGTDLKTVSGFWFLVRVTELLG
jgi:hypothetical protein